MPTYAKVKYAGVYPGVDLVYYGNQGQLEYDFLVAPNADPRAIKLNIVAAVSDRRPAMRTSPLQIDANGDLAVKISGSEVRFRKPVVYQPATGELQPRTAVDGRYRLTHRQVTFEVGSYDKTRPLMIDPAVSYSTYLGGSARDSGTSIAVDTSGNAYVTGYTESSDFPTTPGAFQNQCNNCNPSKDSGDAFVAKLNSTGSALVYSTYLGGSANDFGSSISVDVSGNAYIAGSTQSTDFPTTPGGFQTTCGGGCIDYDAFVTKLNTTGSALVYSTFLGGSANDTGYAVGVSPSGNAYVTGQTSSADFPTTPGAFQTKYLGTDSNAFVTQLNSTGSALTYSTYLGGDGEDFGTGVAVDASGNAYVTGYTNSNSFPTTPGAFQTTGEGAFATKVNPTGSSLIYSTYLSPTDGCSGIAVDASGNAYVTGSTESQSFPVTPGAFQTTCRGGNTCVDAFVTEFNSAGSALVYSTYLGGSKNDNAASIAVDAAGDAFVAGGTASPDFPVTPGAFDTTCSVCGPGYSDAFVTELDPTGSALVYSTYLGAGNGVAAAGVTLDASGGAYVTGSTYSGFPVTPGALQANCGGGCGSGQSDAFVTKFVPGDQVWPLDLSFGNSTVGMSSAPQTTALTNSGTTLLNITGISVTGANSADFSETNNCGSSLAAGASCTFTVIFTPSISGAESATITITDNAANSPQTVALTGTGVLPATMFSLPSLNFRVQLVYTPSQPQTVTLTNTGLGILTLTSIAASGQFNETNTCGATLNPEASCTITVKFFPVSKGVLTGAVTFVDNAPGSPQTVSLTGTGTYVQLLPASVSFGIQPVGTTSLPRTVSLTNQGHSTIGIAGVAITGTDAGDFSETNTCGPTLASGASCSISVTFTPSAKGKRTADVSISDSGGGSPQIVPLSGTGT